ncbi:ribonuclease H protein [Pyrus ussuriensis x Pyrus communis]|uniref:Ribonuclease H protein n=1 Tax=Pyrus ussuriensis x Pyrus communis TaxID=2448454 RepID=A0A5N5GKL0_9ROSA|nr:ribonuclease H protein [Pyrus ussuriensis x Pyrus communis]
MKRVGVCSSFGKRIQHRASIGKYLGVHNVVFCKDPVNGKELILKVQQRLLGLFCEFASNILIAEGQALEDGILRTTLSKGDARLIVEGDSKFLIDAIVEAF